MIISTRGRYALRVMIDLAGQDPNTYTPLKEIAARQEISEKYLENILKSLVTGGLIFGLYYFFNSPSHRGITCTGGMS